MFNKLTKRSMTASLQINPALYSDREKQSDKENYNFNQSNKIPPISFKNSIAQSKAMKESRREKGASTDRLVSSVTSEYLSEYPQIQNQLLKGSLSNSNLREGIHMTKSSERSQGESQGINNTVNPFSFASAKLAMRRGLSKNIQEFDRVLRYEVMSEIGKRNFRGLKPVNPVRDNELLCQGNHNKKGKYRLRDPSFGQYMYYCSKCAIKLVQKGYQIEEIQEDCIPYLTRRQECVNLITHLSEAEKTLKSELRSLEAEKFDESMQERLQKIEQIYDIIILIIEQMKAKDTQTTRRTIEEAQMVKNAEIVALEQQIQKINDTIVYIQGTMHNTLLDLPEPEFQAIVDYHYRPIEEANAYKPLTVTVKQDPLEKILQTIFEEIGDHFNNLKIGGNLSRIESNVIEEQSNDFTLSDLKQRPFRNLFIGEDVSFNR